MSFPIFSQKNAASSETSCDEIHDILVLRDLHRESALENKPEQYFQPKAAHSVPRQRTLQAFQSQSGK